MGAFQGPTGGPLQATPFARALAAEGWDLVLNYWQPYGSRMPWGIQPDDVAAPTGELEAAGGQGVVPAADLDTSLESFEHHFAANTRASWQFIAGFARQAASDGGFSAWILRVRNASRKRRPPLRSRQNPPGAETRGVR